MAEPAPTVAPRATKAIVVSAALHGVLLWGLIGWSQEPPPDDGSGALGAQLIEFEAASAQPQPSPPPDKSSKSAMGGLSGEAGAPGPPKRDIHVSAAEREAAKQDTHDPAKQEAKQDTHDPAKQATHDPAPQDTHLLRPAAGQVEPGAAKAPRVVAGSVVNGTVVQWGDGGSGGLDRVGRGRGSGQGAGVGPGTGGTENAAPASHARPPILIYPKRFRDERDGEVFIAQLTVSVRGVVVGVKLVQGVDRHSDEKALGAVWRFRYKPALDDSGRPIRAVIEQRFMLDR